MASVQHESGLARAGRYAIPFVLLLIPLWAMKVNSVVPDAYLDEVFHVPQAQAYWAHRWREWNPKLTTPPGLYLWSYVLCACALKLRGSPQMLDAVSLRFTSAAVLAVFLPWRLQTLIDALRRRRNTRPAGAWLSHTVLNVCLFPPLFFFSGLYYTDGLALLAVIEAYNWDVKRSGRGSSSRTTTVLETAAFVCFGLAALVCRQTNIFWVAVFLGGLRAVRLVRESSRLCVGSRFVDVVRGSLQNELYDPPVAEASLPDYVKTAISLVLAAWKNLGGVLAAVVPYGLLLAAFGVFVIWNNGVVLGHKEFHTAGVHLAQMLYIWPYFVFFSWPILFLPVVNMVVPRRFLPGALARYGDGSGSAAAGQRGLPRLSSVAVVLPAMLAVVHFNTVVHPFTLADNRHYMFYVFRLLLRSHPAVKYAAVVVYFLCSWAVIAAFGDVSRTGKVGLVSGKPQTSLSAEKVNSNNNNNNNKKRSPAKRQAIPAEALAQVQAHIRARQQQAGTRVSFVLVWLAATALALVTAPLVEPRYFIVPWVMWRIHIAEPRGREGQGSLATHVPALLETAWYLVVNGVTGYVFLYAGFEWAQEPNQIQRFMW